MIGQYYKPERGQELNWADPLARGLVIAAAFNDGTGELVHDSTGMYPGTASGIVPATDWVATPHGHGMNFDGTDEKVDFGDVTQLNSATEFTMHAIVAHDAVDSFEVLARKYQDNQNRLAWESFATGAGTLNFIFEVANTEHYGYYYYSNITANGEWCQITVVYNGAGAADADKLKMYHDGAQQSLTFANTPIPSSTLDFSGYSWTLGAGGAATWDGRIALYLLYNRALQADEVARLTVNPWVMWEPAFDPGWMYVAPAGGVTIPVMDHYYRQRRVA